MTVAIAHDQLTRRSNTERIVRSMVDALPGASVHCALYAPASCDSAFHRLPIATSPLSASRFLRERPAAAFPLMRSAISDMRIDADVTLASSTGWAHGVATTGRKIVYCHAPAPWLYGDPRDRRHGGPAVRAVVRSGGRRLRVWDRVAALSADHYLAISTAVRRQVASIYGIDAQVLHPPVHVDPGAPRSPVAHLATDFVLCVAGLDGHDRVDIVLDAARRLPGAHLVVVGSGSHAPALRAAAPRNVTFVGEVSDRQLRWLYARAHAVVEPFSVAFRRTPVEAAAFATPTVGWRAGSHLDTVRDGVTGLLIDEVDASALAAAVTAAVERPWRPAALVAHARRFSEERFARQLRSVVLGDPVEVTIDVTARAARGEAREHTVGSPR